MQFLLASFLCSLVAKATALLQNVALLKGQTLTYRCNTSIEVDYHSWYFIPLGKNVETTIYMYTTNGVSGHFVERVQMNDSSLILTIPSIQLDDAGIYGCKTLRNSTLINEMAQVVVIESNLQICKDEASRLTCEVKYRGNLGPVIEWTNDRANEPITINPTLRNESDASGTRHLTLMTDLINSSLTCKLYFKHVTTHFENISTSILTYTDRRNSSVSCASSSATTTTSSASHNIVSAVHYKLLSGIVGSFFFILIIVVIGLILEQKRVLLRTKWKSRKKRSKPMELPGPDIVQSDDTATHVVIEEEPDHVLPIYARILSEDSDYLSPDESQTTNENRFIAPDGTEYMIMNLTTPVGTSFTMTPVAPVSSMFISTVYASIDHTLQSHCTQPMTSPQSPGPQTSMPGIYRHTISRQPPIPSPRNISRKK